ncbi:MAG TPA: aspartyl/asparaginyl beta-hydroxylase domain-containing protein [Allosphingosinicella sp.]|nr:aspartyl/asparaginyl beta-hydroxylase domain-containing protein [Allosphingosinicella sp.]
MENFVPIATGLDTAPALAALAALDPIYWVGISGNAAPMVPLLGPDGRRRHVEALGAVWDRIETVHTQAACAVGDSGAIYYARAGVLPPGGRVLPHADGHDGALRRRYQVILKSPAEALITLGGETRSLRAGEAWQIDSGKVHEVVNNGAEERIILVFDTGPAAQPSAPA